MRRRATAQDLSILIALFLVAIYVAFEVDIYENQDGVTKYEETIELDEALTLGGLLRLGSPGICHSAIRRTKAGNSKTDRRRTARPRTGFPGSINRSGQ